MRTFLAAFLLTTISSIAHAAPPPGTDLDSPLHHWFENQHSVNGAWCCNLADGHILDNDEWRESADHYEVLIEGTWYPVPMTALRDPKGGPNPTGQPIVWYLKGASGDIVIFCFCPGTES